MRVFTSLEDVSGELFNESMIMGRVTEGDVHIAGCALGLNHR